MKNISHIVMNEETHKYHLECFLIPFMPEGNQEKNPALNDTYITTTGRCQKRGTVRVIKKYSRMRKRMFRRTVNEILIDCIHIHKKAETKLVPEQVDSESDQSPFFAAGNRHLKSEHAIMKGLTAGIEVPEFINHLPPKRNETYQTIYLAYLSLNHYHYEFYTGYETSLISYLRNIISRDELMEINENAAKDTWRNDDIVRDISQRLDPNMK